MIRRALIVTILVLAAGAVGGCGITGVGQPLSAEITADAETASVGDTITFRVTGTGRFLSGLAIDYGDGSKAQGRDASGQETSAQFNHAYGATGTYEVIGAVFDSSGQMNDTLEVVIEPLTTDN